jgi:L-2,4-diaminobutyric acid acetyltransferase
MVKNNDIVLRAARPQDARNLWSMLDAVGGLERNSCYAYVLLCSHFASTSVIAEQGRQVLGFLLAYRPPSDPESVFVWQIGVAPMARGAGLGRRMLGELVTRPACRDARFLTATVSDDNSPSLALFRGFARDRRLLCRSEVGFAASLFAEAHPDEPLLRIGPLKGNS